MTTRLPKFRLAAARAAAGDHFWVYYVAGAERIKIGATVNVPRLRLQTLQSCSPVALELVAVEPGMHREGERHEQFRALHSHGEWFDASADLLAHVAAIRDTHGAPDSVYGVPTNLLREALRDGFAEMVAT